jgi:hypothetical protein
VAVGTAVGVGDAVGVGEGLGVITVTATVAVEPPLLETDICADPAPTEVTVKVAGAVVAVSGVTDATCRLLDTAVYGGVPPLTMNEPDWPASLNVRVVGVTVIAVSNLLRLFGVEVGIGVGVACGITVGIGVAVGRAGSATAGVGDPSGTGRVGGCIGAGATPRTMDSMMTERPLAPSCWIIEVSPLEGVLTGR